MRPGEDFTQTLQAAIAGDSDAHALVTDAAYARLREIAGRRLAHERPGLTLQPTELVSEAWMKLAKHNTPLNDRKHFLALAARAMRQILIDHERKRRTDRRGGHLQRCEMPVELDDPREDGKTFDLIEVDLLLQKLEAIHSVRARIVEMRLFAGMDTDSIAASVNLSRTGVIAHLRSATAWLEAHLNGV